MSNFTLVMIAPESYELEDFELAGDAWSATSGDTTISIDTSHDSPRESVLKILGNGAAGDADGAYKDFTVVPGMTWFFSCLYYCSAGTLRIQLYDQTNGASISYVDKTETSWAAYETSATIPANCVTVRIKLLQQGSNQGPYYVDDLSFQPNVIDKDADSYTRDPVWVGSLQQNLGGRRVSDLRSAHHSFLLHWNFLSEAQFEFLREAFNAGERMYFDDGDVAQMKETGIYRTNETLTFSGIIAPSSTHKAYEDADDAMPTTKTALETTEFATADYQAVDGDDSNYADSTSAGVTDWDPQFLFHKFCLESGVTSANTRRVRFKVKCSSDDDSTPDKDGCIVYGWDATSWVKLDSHSSSDNAALEFREMIPTEAAKFVDAVDSYIRLLLKSKGSWDAKGQWVKKAGQYASGYSYATLVFNSKLYAINNAGHLLEWDESSSWASKGSTGEGALTAMCEYDGKIYCGGGSSVADGKLYEWNGTDTLTEVAPKLTTHVNIEALVVYDSGGGDNLYGVTADGLVEWDDVDEWVEEGTLGADVGWSGVVYDSTLYVGGSTGNLYTWNDVDTLTLVAAMPSGIRDLVEFVSELYCIGGYRLYKYDDASSIDALTPVRSDAFLCGAVFDSKLYIGDAAGALLEYDASGAEMRVKCPVVNINDMWDLVEFDSDLYGVGEDTGDDDDLVVLSAADASYLRTYYVESEVNEDLGSVIQLSHRAVLTAGDVVSVKNLTAGTALTLTTHYTIATDRRSVTVSAGAVDGDEIEVTYSRYFEVMFRDLPERWLTGDPGSARHRIVDVILDTVEGD